MPQYLFVYQQPLRITGLQGSYRRPDDLASALELLAAGDMTIAAGCTDLFPATESKTLPGRVLDVTGIGELSGISWTDRHLRIGATTTWSEILRADLPASLRSLQLAAREVGAKQIQNRGTVAGNLCNASPAADGVPPLLTVDAEVELRSQGGSRSLPLSEFIAGPRKTALEGNEILTAVLIPRTSLAGSSHFLKLGARAYLVISIAMVAARVSLEGGLVTEAALAVGACGPVATRLPDLERALTGQPFDLDRIHRVIDDAAVASALSPIDDVRAEAAYRAGSAAELLRRGLAELLPAASEAA